MRIVKTKQNNSRQNAACHNVAHLSPLLSTNIFCFFFSFLSAVGKAKSSSTISSTFRGALRMQQQKVPTTLVTGFYFVVFLYVFFFFVNQLSCCRLEV